MRCHYTVYGLRNAQFDKDDVYILHIRRQDIERDTSIRSIYLRVSDELKYVYNTWNISISLSIARSQIRETKEIIDEDVITLLKVFEVLFLN